VEIPYRLPFYDRFLATDVIAECEALANDGYTELLEQKRHPTRFFKDIGSYG
jgi:hypothetical protein